LHLPPSFLGLLKFIIKGYKMNEYEIILSKHTDNGIVNYRTAYSEAIDIISEMSKELAHAKDRMEVADRVSVPNGGMLFRDFAKAFKYDFPFKREGNKQRFLGGTLLFQFLRKKGVLQNGGSEHNVPYSSYCNRHPAIFDIQSRPIDMGGVVRYSYTTRIFNDGALFINKLLQASIEDGSLEEQFGVQK